MKVIKCVIIKFNSIQLRTFDIPKFRGYLAKKYPDYVLIHNHLTDNKFRYSYPLIQFKLIDKIPAIIGIGDGIDILKKVFLDIQELNIGGHEHKINEKSVMLNEIKMGQIEKNISYHFLLPWMGLNSENYEKYKELKWHEKRTFLEIIISRNLKSLSKGLNYFIPDFKNIHVQAKLKQIYRNFKNIKMICFEGGFTTNFIIPDYLGIVYIVRPYGTTFPKTNLHFCSVPGHV